MTEPREPDPVERLLAWSPLAWMGLAALASLLALPRLPERGWLASVVMLGVMAFVWLIMGTIGRATLQTREARALSPRLLPAVTSMVVALILLMHLALLATLLGWRVSFVAVTNVGAGLLFVAVGWMMRNVPQNAAFGVRTPTTLADPRAWRRANRVGGWALVIAGMATALAGWLPEPWPIAVLLGSVVVASLVAVIAGQRAARDPDGEAR